MQKNLNLNLNKAGVSLIAVLLFMLVATIAATATWKWITSEGRSSSSRMLQREAYQSSQAGIENARAWMTFHGNDVGALVKQFLDDPAHKPINIDDRLRSIQRAGQNYHVWLTGVNTENSTYKLKILSSGEARNNARHTEVAIFNVDGLYRVKVASKVNVSSSNYEYAYYGGSIYFQGGSTVSSMVVNGNWEHNPPQIAEGDFIVTGNAILSGNSIDVKKTACIGGTLSATNGFKSKDLYVAGEAVSFNPVIEGDAYFDGPMSMGTACGSSNFQIHGNATVNAVLNFNACDDRYIAGNTCVLENGQIKTNGSKLLLKGSAWMSAPYSLWRDDDDNYSSYANLVVGTTSSDDVYIKNAYPYSSYVSHRTNKTFTEGVTTGDQPNKICNSINYGGAYTCKTWGTCTYGMGMFARTYKCCKEYEESGGCSEWVTWEGESYSPYSEVTSQENLHYLFKLDDGIDDVNFDSRHDDYWNVDVSNYFVGGQVFYDLWNIWTEFNYSNGAPTASPYCKKDRAHSNGSKTKSAHRPICGVRPWFKIDGTLKTWTDEKPIVCAEGVKKHCFEIWESTPGTGCDNSNFKVKDMLKTGYTEFVKKANAAPCVQTILNLDDNAKNNYNVAGLNSCYSTASTHDKSNVNDPYLYNGYLVVEMSDAKLFKNPTGELKGKYIFIVTSKDGEAIKAPPTATNKDYVMLYLEEGYGEINMQHAAGLYNYFIYTKGDITKVMGQTSSPLRGSIYATASNCSKVDNIWSSNLEFNKKLMNDMTTNGILCDASVTKCGVETTVSSSSSSSDDPADLVGGYDTYHISMAPQLGVRLESQNKSSESLPPVRYDAEKPDLDSSFIVLPRVLSLPNDPYGTLLDYINVIPLNGSHLDKTKLSLSTEGCKEIDDASMSLGVTSLSQKLYDPSGSKLEEGYYKCIIKATNYTQTMPVWVIVGESQRAVPVVSFVEESQSIGATDSKVVHVKVRPHDQKFNLNVDCPANDETPTWSITKELAEKGTGDPCVFEIPANPSEEETISLFTVSTANASSGTKQFQLLAGEGYIIGNAYADVHISSVATLNRVNASQGEIESYCTSAASGVCPTNINEWPDCNIDEAWVEPSGAGFITNVKNNSWTITVGGTGTLTLSPVSTKCVVIIPSQSIDLADFEAGETKTLKASAKVKKSTLKVKFVGDVGSGNNPVVNIEPEDRTGSTCTYNSSGSNKECSVDLFGEKVSLSIDKNLSDNSEFSYWQCSGNSCPTTDGISSAEYDAFLVTDDATTIYVHFGESDKHCFFDEYRNSAPGCASLLDNETRKYCIDICGDEDDHCESAGSTGSDYSNAKWHLVKGVLSNIELKNGAISVKKDGDVTVMSTVNAGVSGTLKALVQLPQVGGSNVANTRNANIRNTGFLLRSNDNATAYLMLSVYTDQNDRVVAQVCVEDGSSCLSGELTRNSEYLYASTGNMVMINAKITASDELMVSAFRGNYYGSPLVYTRTFNLKKLNTTYHSSEHGFVGYRLANREFKLHGVGWISEEFASECHETPPIVKCSFAAVAKDGVIPLEQNVKPWIGHSGWFDSRKYSCEEKYYYNGMDGSCSVLSAGTYGSCESGYTFSTAGQHGYTDTDGNEVNTAKAGLRCSLGGDDGMWAADPEDADNGAQNRAHCGMFWTGTYTQCTENKVLYDNEKTVAGGAEETISITTNNNNGINLRSTSLKIEVDNPDGNEIEVWLYSMHPDRYDEMLPSRSVIMCDTKGSFDVASEFANTTSGFDPEKVVQVAFINKGVTSVKVTRIDAVCANATGVDGCSVKREGNLWTISATILNRTNVTGYKVTGKRKGPGQENAESFDVTGGGWKSADEVTTNGNVVTFTYTSTDGGAGPAAGDYDFTVYVTPDNGTTQHSQRCSGGLVKESRCDVHEPKPAPGQTNVEITEGQNNPQFKVHIHECSNCAYVVKFNGTPFATGSCPEKGICEVKKTYSTKQSVGTDYIYTISSAEDTPRFTDCEAKFDVVAGSGNNNSSNTITLSNCSDITGQDPSQYVTLYPYVTGCNANCSYTVSPATDDAQGSNSSVNVVQFKNTNGNGGPIEHTLTVSKEGVDPVSCTFNVTFSGNNGGGNNSEDPTDDPEEETLSCNSDNSNSVSGDGQSITSKTCYSFGYTSSGNDTWARKLVVENKGNSSITMTYKDCSGSQHTKIIEPGTNLHGNEGGNYWYRIDTVELNGSCTIYFQMDQSGTFNFAAW